MRISKIGKVKLQVNKPVSPRFLIHDNTIFNDVDELQIARALELAAQESVGTGFQYIDALNYDWSPYNKGIRRTSTIFNNAISY